MRQPFKNDIFMYENEIFPGLKFDKFIDFQINPYCKRIIENGLWTSLKM